MPDKIFLSLKNEVEKKVAGQKCPTVCTLFLFIHIFCRLRSCGQTEDVQRWKCPRIEARCPAVWMGPFFCLIKNSLIFIYGQDWDTSATYCVRIAKNDAAARKWWPAGICNRKVENRLLWLLFWIWIIYWTLVHLTLNLFFWKY
jgi:hypothetical protein